MKKVWPIALAATAIFFTAGAALAPAGSWLSGMGWGKVASTLVTKVGIKGTLGKVLTGSVAGAGWGAAIGGGVSAATGGSFTEGARSGALSGAITGGLAGAAGWTPGVKPSSAPATNDPSPGGNSLIDFLKGTGKWVEKNPVVAGNLISGVGKGIGTAAAARTQADMATAERQAFDDRLAQLSDNYRVSREALGLPPLEQQVATPSLAETAVPDVAARTEVDPLQVSAGGPLSPAEEMRRQARKYPNSLVARGLGVG